MKRVIGTSHLHQGKATSRRALACADLTCAMTVALLGCGSGGDGTGFTDHRRVEMAMCTP
jgi:hypothetical protein